MKNIEFEKRNKENIKLMGKDQHLKNITREWYNAGYKYEYSYHFTWLGRPIIQYPQDMITIQEIIWKVKPDLIIEIGIAHGGSLIFSASILELLGHGEVLGIDIDIRGHNREEIEKHPMYKRITMIEGSSISKNVAKKVYKFSEDKKRIMVFLDSNHTHNHVLNEMKLYSQLVSKGSYMVVFDTMIEDLSAQFLSNRPWDKHNNPKTAIREFLKTNHRFQVDETLDAKLLITSCLGGYLKCIK